jgi:hypothetical protein
MHNEQRNVFIAIVQNNISIFQTLSDVTKGHDTKNLEIYQALLKKLVDCQPLDYEDVKQLSLGLVSAEQALLIQKKNIEGTLKNFDGLLKPRLKSIIDGGPEKFAETSKVLNKPFFFN